jgi:hypothetical protein
MLVQLIDSRVRVKITFKIKIGTSYKSQKQKDFALAS